MEKVKEILEKITIKETVGEAKFGGRTNFKLIVCPYKLAEYLTNKD